MSKSRRQAGSSMLELWRPPQGAGDPVGCLTTTYTFDPAVFDEQCLARFLEIESEPNREDLAFLLEREQRLGGIYAGVLVDHAQAGVEHSLRWDVLPVRIPRGKQHAKLSVVAWMRMIRVIVASANLTDSGYRFNQEVAVPLDASSEQGNGERVLEACDFLTNLLAFVPAAITGSKEIKRAQDFVAKVREQAQTWTAARRGEVVRQRLVFTIPAGPGGSEARSSLDEAMDACRRRGASPDGAWVASPFYDPDPEYNRAAATLCKSMARSTTRYVSFCVPCIGDPDEGRPRLAAPWSLLETQKKYADEADYYVLPQRDAAGNARAWHAKMMVLQADSYFAMLVGSSNFTTAGLGIEGHRNAEANVLTIVERQAYGRQVGELDSVWPEMQSIEDPEAAEWLGPSQALDEDEAAGAVHLPAGFLSAVYRAGDERRLIFCLDAAELPADWAVCAFGQHATEVLSAGSWLDAGSPSLFIVPWEPAAPPEKLRVTWAEGEAFWVINVEDARHLPPPPLLEEMSADDILFILAASDPSAAFRAWTRRRLPSDFDEELDAATPVDLDPLHRYDLNATFLHRVRRRARVLAEMRRNLQRSVWSRQALEWRLRGLIGVEPLAMKLVQEVLGSNGKIDEAVLTLADLLIVLSEVAYEPEEGAMGRTEFAQVYRPFLKELVVKIDERVLPLIAAGDLRTFWEGVVRRCQE